MGSHDALVVEARAALPLDGGVKCRRPERVKTEGTVPCQRRNPWRNGPIEEKKQDEI